MNFEEKLAAYGVDVAVTMERLGNSEDLYLRCVDLFLNDGNMEELGKALEQGDLKKGFEAAHALKGVSANLGLQPFYEKICKIVEPLRAADEQADYKTLYEEIALEEEKVKVLRAELGEK